MSCLAPARTDPGAAAGLARFGPQSQDFSSYHVPLLGGVSTSIAVLTLVA